MKTPHNETVLGTFEVAKPLQLAGFVANIAAHAPETFQPSFITTSENVLRKICIDVKRDWNIDYGGVDAQGFDYKASAEKTLQKILAAKKFLGFPLLIENTPAFDDVLKVSNFDLSECVIVKLKEI